MDELAEAKEFYCEYMDEYVGDIYQEPEVLRKAHDRAKVKTINEFVAKTKLNDEDVTRNEKEQLANFIEEKFMQYQEVNEARNDDPLKQPLVVGIFAAFFATLTGYSSFICGTGRLYIFFSALTGVFIIASILLAFIPGLRKNRKITKLFNRLQSLLERCFNSAD